MQAGLLRDFVTIKKSTITINQNNGEQTCTWSQLWRGRARVEFSSGSRIMENNETINTITKRVTIRTKPSFNYQLTDLMIEIGGSSYRILSMDVRKQDQATIFIVELINN